MAACAWQLARHCSPDLASLSNWYNSYWNDNGSIHAAEWFQASLSMSTRLSRVASSGRVDDVIIFRDQYESSKWSVKTIRFIQNDVDCSFIILQHSSLPQVIIARPIRDICARVRVHPKTNVRVDIVVHVRDTDVYCEMQMHPNDTVRKLHDRILHWLRFCRYHTTPEFQLALNIVLDYDDTPLLDVHRNQRTLKDIMETYGRQIGMAVDPRDDWRIPSSDESFGSDVSIASAERLRGAFI